MNNIIESENKIKEQLKYIETKEERAKVPAINLDSMKRCVKNEELFYRALHK